MALGGARMMASSPLEQLLDEINFQRTKEMRQLLKDESGFVVLQGTTYWTDLFVRNFLFQEDRSIDCDDLLFFVRKRHVKGSSRYLPKYETSVQVFRKDSKKLPVGDPEVEWEETVYLNLAVHQLEYTVTLAVCTRTSPRELQVLRRRSHTVYASPSRRKMDTKGEGEEMTYPYICFMVDNFDEVFCDIVVRDGEMVCVELVARGRGSSVQAVIFLGSIRYDALSRVYDSRQSSLSTKMAQRMTFGLLGGKSGARCEFVRMKGPGGKGHAEMAVMKPRGAGADTPTSEPGVSATDMWDSDLEEDPEDMFIYRHQRRLSDPSANLNNFVRGGWRTKDANKDKSRSENEGLDSLVNGIAEVEAGDLKDVASSARWCCAGRARSADMRDVYSRSADRDAGPACLQHVSPRRARRLARPEARPPPLVPLVTPARRSDECELADDAAELDGGASTGRPGVPAATPASRRECREVRGSVELPCRPEPPSPTGGPNSGARAYCTLPRRHGGVAAVMYKNEELPLRRTTPDGTNVYYWCDMPAKRHTELDDGAYNPLWAMRGFTQTFHLWKEGKRQQSAPLHAYLTYVTLPWWSIAKDILDLREEPILTF